MKIGIIGLGLIGGSMGLEFCQAGQVVLGVSRRPETCKQAVDRGVVTAASTDLALMAAADVVFICTPLGAIEPTTLHLLPHLAPHAIVTDVGSVKVPIVEAIAPRWQRFVGGHPMAGTSDRGLEAAQLGLFTNRVYVLTPTSTTPADAVETVAALAKILQSQVHHCQPDEHDRAVAWISHLPVMVSATLIAACMNEPDATVLALAHHLASSGFRDTSRVGGGNPELGRMMAEYNQSALLDSLRVYQSQLATTIQHVEKGDWRSLEQLLVKTQLTRTLFTQNIVRT